MLHCPVPVVVGVMMIYYEEPLLFLGQGYLGIAQQYFWIINVTNFHVAVRTQSIQPKHTIYSYLSDYPNY